MCDWIGINKKMLLFIILPIFLVIIAITVFTFKPKPKYDALNNPILEKLLKDQSEKITELNKKVSKINAELNQKKTADSLLDIYMNAEIERLKNKKNTTTIIYEKQKQNITLDDVDADVIDLRRRLPKKVNP